MARQSRAVPCLLTRPAAQGDRFAAGLADRFGGALRLVQAPLLAPVFLAPAIPDPLAGVIFTSETGVAALARLIPAPRGLPAWCVGGRTAEAARRAGFAPRSAEGDAEDLLRLLLADPKAAALNAPLLHARGQEARGELSRRLADRGIAATEAVVYAQQPQPLTAEAQALLARPGPVLLPLFSPRTAALFRAAAPAPLAALHAIAMSPAVARALDGVPLAGLTLAGRPDADAMQEAVGRTLGRLDPA
jgi:uroporphyrinogen-III synthase